MKRRVLIIGGSLAGLTAAIRLSELGYHVTVLEQDGTFTPSGSSTGTHEFEPVPTVLMGCHSATWTLLETLETANHLRTSHRVSFEFAGGGRRAVRFCRPLMPGSMRAVVGLALFSGLSVGDRWRFLMWMERTWEKDPALPADLDHHTAEAWLRSIGQSERARTQIWTPLCRFLLGNDARSVSAAVFLHMLGRCFLSVKSRPFLTVPAHNLSRMLIEPAYNRLVKSGVAMRLCAQVRQIDFNIQRVTAVRLQDGTTLTADWYVAALRRRSLSPLLPERTLTLYSYFQQVPQLTDGPAVSVHFRVRSQPKAPRLLLLSGRTFHWIVVKPALNGDRCGLLSLAATGHEALLERTDEELAQAAVRDVRAALPAIELFGRDYHIVREPEAFLALKPGATAMRPLQQSPFPNFFLAGEWTDTGLPADLESAILSGELCARAIASKGAR